MKNRAICKRISTKKHHFFLYASSSKIQGIGFMVSAYNPTTPDDCIIVEFKLLWFKCWYQYIIE